MLFAYDYKVPSILRALTLTKHINNCWWNPNPRVMCVANIVNITTLLVADVSHIITSYHANGVLTRYSYIYQYPYKGFTGPFTNV